jgi:hypothetical protein
MDERRSFRSLASGLIQIGDQPNERTLELVTNELGRVENLPEMIVRHCGSLRSDELDELLARSTERSTHYKWCLASSGHRGVRIWLHVYKRWQSAEAGFAASIHDHRYSFVSAVLTGMLIERRWSPNGPREIKPGLCMEYGPGNIYSIRDTEIHSIEKALPGTITFVVQLATTKPTSLVFNPRTLELERQIPDLGALFSPMLRQLAGLERLWPYDGGTKPPSQG